MTLPSRELYRIHRLLDSRQVQEHHVRLLRKPRTSLDADYFPGNAGCVRVWRGCLASNHTLQDTCIKVEYEQLVARVVNAVAMGLVQETNMGHAVTSSCNIHCKNSGYPALANSHKPGTVKSLERVRSIKSVPKAELVWGQELITFKLIPDLAFHYKPKLEEKENL